ncbi:MAG: domain found in IF2B/IF5-domain-containing protein [Linnemannia gamsii]|nr:MAG: domain found in IF2B/IF5-domain-containing protein [Linnemannia gamsii]
MPRPANNNSNAKGKKGAGAGTVNKRKLMNSMVNIPSTNPDPYYRYKMPAMEIRINPSRVRTNNPQKEAQTIPASTQLQNLPSIARALNRPLEYITKYLELELDLAGVHEDRQRWFKLCDAELAEQELMMVLDKFIRRFVLCFVCHNPETALTVFNTHIMKECGACGQSTRVDRFSKLTRYIVRNRTFALGIFALSTDASKCRFLKEGASMPGSKGTVMNAAAGFKNGVKLATAAEMADDDEEEEEDDDDDQDWKLDTSAEAVALRRLQELDLITRVEKIMNSGLGDKAKGENHCFHAVVEVVDRKRERCYFTHEMKFDFVSSFVRGGQLLSQVYRSLTLCQITSLNHPILDPYKLFEEFVTTPKEETKELPDKEEVLGRFYTLDLEKEGAIFVLERLQKRQQQQEEEEEEEEENEPVKSNGETEETGKDTKAMVVVHQREDYEDMIQVLRESLEREVIVASTLDNDESSSGSDSDDDDDDTDSDSAVEE